MVSDVQLDYSRTNILRVGEAEAEAFVNETLEEFTTEAKREFMIQDIEFEDAMLLPSLDMRYVGQSYELNVSYNGLEAAQTRFYDCYRQQYGYYMPSEAVEIVNVRLHVMAARAKPKPPKVVVNGKGKPVGYIAVLFVDGREKIPVYRRDDLPLEHEGAAIIEAKDSTIVVPPGTSFSVDLYGNIIMHIA